MLVCGLKGSSMMPAAEPIAAQINPLPVVAELQSQLEAECKDTNIESAFNANNEASILFNGLFGSYFASLGDDLHTPKARIALAWQNGSKWRHEYFADTFLAGCRADDLRE